MKLNFNLKQKIKMKKTIFSFVMAAMAAAVMTSCTTGKIEVEDDGERVAVQFASEIAGVSTRVNNTTWDGNEHIGIFMIEDGTALAAGTIKEGADNVQYETASTGIPTASFAPSSGVDPIYYPAAGSVNFIAYYPYNAAATGGLYSLPISVAIQSSQSAIDVLYAPATTTYDKNTTGAVTLPFEHKLVKLKFNISNGAGVTAPLTDLAVTISGLNTQATLNLVSGAVTPVVAPAMITAVTVSVGLPPTSASAEAIVLPLTDNSGITLTFTNGASEVFTAAVPDIGGNTTWESGKSYTYTVALKKNGINIEGSIAPWLNGGTGITDAE
jgi:hypothetical protein